MVYGWCGPFGSKSRHASISLTVVSDEVEYSGLVAQSWDLFRGDTSGWPDRGFFRQVIAASGEPVLDVGCGTGRLLLDYLAAGIDIDGIDISPDMLAICRRRGEALGLRPRPFEQRMEKLNLPRHYRTIIVPSSSFQLVLEPAAAADAVRQFHNHLLSSGTLAAPFMVIDSAAARAGESWTEEAVRPEDGALIRRRTSTRYEPATQFEHADETYEVIVDGRLVASERHRRSPATRGYRLDQARAIFEGGGFRIDQVLSGFTDSPYREGGAIFTILARPI